MAQNDIYNHKLHWESFIRKLESGEYSKPKDGIYIKNPENIQYFKKVFNELEFRDISFHRRCAYVWALKKTCYLTSKDLKDVTREDVKEIIRLSNQTSKTYHSRIDFINYNKGIWKILFPERDSQGRFDESIVPYPWRFKIKMEKSKRKPEDKLTFEGYEKIRKIFSQSPMMALFTSLIYEDYARPQELCYIDLLDIEMFESYARIKINEHSKERPKELQLLESDNLPLLLDWLDIHPLKNQGMKNPPLFVDNHGNRLTVDRANKIIKKTLKSAGIIQRITCYSFKRNGISHALINGEDPQVIQKKNGWTTTSQLKTYDQSNQYDFFDRELKEEKLKKIRIFRKEDEIKELKDKLSELQEKMDTLLEKTAEN